ncbi:MAG: dependent oxidoreductase [Deltaproteobacteria bacterium]|nr:dependent oxidoreductase [Deltaproteobacteria bacterium]
MVNGSACYKAPVSLAATLPPQADVVIIGGGFAGCATAWALAERGVRALVLEREPALGRHASGRGAGLGRQLVEDDVTSALVIRGAAVLRERFATAWSPTGGILSFDDEERAGIYEARARRLGIAYERIDRAAVLARWPAMTGVPIVVALLVPSDGIIDVRAVLDSYASGLQLACDVGVTSISEVGGGVRLDTTRGAVHAKVVVDATGAWAGQLTGASAVESFKRHLFVVEAAPTPAAPYFWHLGRQELYVRSDGAATLASACDVESTSPLDQSPAPDADARLRARLSPAAPAWGETPIVRRWACQRAFTPDRRMRIGRDPHRPWLVWAVGLGGHGATASPAVGELAAAAVLESGRV